VAAIKKRILNKGVMVFMDEKEQINIKVIESQCKFYKPGDQIVIEGPLINLERSDNVCVTALSSFFPFVYALRKGVTPEQMGFSDRVMVQCPDYCAPVVFELTFVK